MSEFLATLFILGVFVFMLPATQTFEPKLYEEAVLKCESNQGVKMIKLTSYDSSVYCVNDAKFTLKINKGD